MWQTLRAAIARCFYVLSSGMPDEREILRRIHEEMEMVPTLAQASRWARDLESLEPYFLIYDKRTPMQIRLLVEAKGRVYDLLDALENGQQPPHTAYYREPLTALKRALEREPSFGF
jgi:hypothetical protein